MCSVVPCSTMRPSVITITRSAIVRMSARSCVMNSRLSPICSRSLPSSSMIAAWTETSSAEVTSSQTSSFGSAASARAIATRWRSPPESWSGKRFAALEASATRSRHSDTRRPASRPPPPHTAAPDGAPAAAEQRELASDRLAHRPPRVQRRVRVLEHVLDLAPRLVRARPRGLRQHVVAEAHLAGVVLVQAGDAARERRLAAARLADEREALVAMHLEVDVEQRVARAVVGVERLDGEHDVRADLALVALAGALGRGLPHRAVVVVAAHLVGGPEVAHRREHLAAVVLGEVAARVEEAALRAAARQRGMARDADDRPLARDVRDRPEQPARVGVARVREHPLAWAGLDDAPGVHHRDAVGELGDHGEVVADVERRDLMAAAQVAHGLEHARLRRHVEAGRRLVAHDHPRAVGEGHRDRDALLLAARELVRVALEERVVAGQRDLLERLAQPRRLLLAGHRSRVRLEDLRELRPDPQRRVQRRARVLRDVRDGAAWQLAQLAVLHRREVATVDADRAAGHRAAAADVAEQRHPDGRLARARLADEAEHLARVDLEADLVDDVDVGPGQLDLQVVDVDRRRPDRLRRAHDLPPRSRPMAARATPSVTRLVPTVSRPIASTGRKTDHGWIPIASRFSLIIRPQSAGGGWRPKPRKLTAATRLIE